MESTRVPASLRERLGPEATAGLLDVFETAHREWRDEVSFICTERFERRLVEETSGLRLEMAGLRADLRHEMAELGANLRQEMAELGANLRQEMVGLGATLRHEMSQLGTDLRGELSASRLELFKWCFVFWVGQVVALTAILGVMLRLLRP